MKNLKLKHNGDWEYRTGETGKIIQFSVHYVKGQNIRNRGLYLDIQPKTIEPDTGTGFTGESYMMYSNAFVLAQPLAKKNDRAAAALAEKIDPFVLDLCAWFAEYGQDKAKEAMQLVVHAGRMPEAEPTVPAGGDGEPA